MADQILQDIKDRLNIADIIGGYIQLKKAGVNFKAACPFHHEKTPSLIISPQKQIWHCFGCFPPGQKVKTPFGLHNIESIDENHFVYSGQGKIRKVLATHKRDFAGKLVTVKVRKLGGYITMTEDHHLIILRPKTKYKKKNKQFYRQCRTDLLKGKFKNAFQAATFHGDILQITAGELQISDFVFYPINTTESKLKEINLKDYLTKVSTFGPRPPIFSYKQKITPELLKLIGYYIAEGSSHRAYVRFSLGNHEEAFANEIVALIKMLFGVKASIHNRNKGSSRTGLEITACHAYLANIFENLCGKGAHNKHIPHIFQEISPKKQKILIEAIHRGDGHNYIANKSDKIHRSVTSVSRILAEQMVDILLRNNLFPSLSIQKEKTDKNGVHHKESYVVVWSEEAESQHNFVISESVQILNWLLPVSEITKKKYKGPVHNLTVEKDHSYVATNFAVANCGEGGDVFGFVTKYENLDFKETLRILADKAGVALPAFKPEDKSQVDEREMLLRINNFASRYYHEVLMSSPLGKSALEYLKNRGLNEITIKRWQIGYARDDFHSLERALLKKKVALSDLVKAGVSTKNERGQIYDRFRGRITFPIFNYFGDVVGFSARILKDDGKSAKYINSPETSIYNKSKTLFGLNFAKDAIRKADEAVLVEGQMDCISLHQAGFNNTVAVSGTALTEAGLIQLGRLTKNLKFCFDSDSAGQMAARRAGELALKNGFRLKIIVLTSAKDPDELLKQGQGLWAKALKESVWFLDFYIDLAQKKYPAGSVDQKLYLSKEVVPFLGFIGDPLEQDHYVKKIANTFTISEKIIRDQIRQTKVNISTKADVGTGGATPGLLIQKEILGGLLFVPKFESAVKNKILPSDFENPKIGELAELWLKRTEGDFQVKNSSLAKEAIFMLESQLEDYSGDTDKLLKQLEKSFSLFKINSLKHQMHQLQAEIKSAESTNNKLLVDELSRKFASILALRTEFERKL